MNTHLSHGSLSLRAAGIASFDAPVAWPCRRPQTCAVPVAPSKFVEIEIYVREPGPAPTVVLADISDSVPGSFTGTRAGAASYRGRLTDRVDVIGYRYTFLGSGLVVGHSYWLSVARPGRDLGGAAFTSAGHGPWLWTYIQPPVAVPGISGRQLFGGGVRPMV